MHCVSCGKAGSGKFCGACGGAMSSLTSGGAFTWPFCQPSWLASLWMTFMWVIPFGNFLSLGWSLDAVRRRAIASPELLPQPDDAPSLFAKGFVVLFFWTAYFVVPLALMAWLMSWSWLVPIWDLVVVLWKAIVHQPHEPVASFLMRNAVVFLSDASAPIIYVALCGPVFLAARIRYAITGRASSFLRFIANAGFCVRHIGDILRYFFLANLLRFCFGLAAVLLIAVPLVGQLLPIALVAAGIWERAFWAGEVGQKLYSEIRSKHSPAMSTASS
jgi:Protein of unknown function (DUF4013)